MAVKLAAMLRKVSFLSKPLLRAANAVVAGLPGSKTIALMFRGLAVLFGGKSRADEIAVPAHKSID